MIRLFQSPFRNKRAGKDHGAILFVAVGGITVLSILALGLTSSILQQLRLAKALTQSNTSMYLASSVIEAMEVVFANDKTPNLITLYDLQSRKIAMGDKVVEIVPSDEQTKINIDLAPKDILSRLPGIAGDDLLIDEIFKADIAAKEELLLYGMSQEIYDELKDFVTDCVHNGININTANGEVLAILGMDEDLIVKIKNFRAGEDGEEGTGDDRYFSSTGEITTLLEPYGLTITQKTLISGLISSLLLGVTSDYIRFDITVTRTGKPQRWFEVVLKLGESRIVSWLEE